MNRELNGQRDLRRFIGVVAMALPFLCLVFAGLQDSISAYYHTRAGDILVGIMVAAGAFLVTYRGYDDTDRRLSTAAGICAVLVALLPISSPLDPSARVGFLYLQPGLSWALHTAAAAILFLILAFIALVQFPKGNSGTARKRARNRVYRVCGAVMVAGLIMAPLGMIINVPGWLWMAETIMLLAFGVAWLVKGESILKDTDI